MGYTKNAVIGVSWMSAYRVITRMMSFVKTAVLARILTPSQFGIFGVATIVLSLLDILTETGINIFLIQSKKDIKEYINSAWVVSIARGTFMMIVIVLTAPFVASFFNTPQAVTILYAISLVPFIRGFINPAVVTFQKELKFSYEFWFRSTLFLVDALVAIVTAVIFQSVYSLVFGLIAGVMLEVILSFILIKPIPRFAFSDGYLSEIFHSGKWVTALGIFNYFSLQGDTIFIGRILGASTLGIYQLAYKISTLPLSEITDIVNKVAFPVYVKIKDDRQRLLRGYLKSTGVITFAATMTGIVIYLFPREVILILLGDKWLSAAQTLQVLAIYGVLRAIFAHASSLFFAVGKQQYVTASTFTGFMVMISTMYFFITTYGMIGASYSVLLSVLLEIPVVLYFILRVFRKSQI